MSTKVVTGMVRFSYVRAFEADDNGKYSTCLLIPKEDEATIRKINKAIEAAFNEGKDKLGKKKLSQLAYPLRDGDEDRETPEYEGHMFVNANTKRRPGVVGREKDDFGNLIGLDEEDFYSGCYGRASINFYAYDFEGKKGIACGLSNLQKLKDGPRLSGGASAEDDFADDFEDDDLLG